LEVLKTSLALLENAVGFVSVNVTMQLVEVMGKRYPRGSMVGLPQLRMQEAVVTGIPAGVMRRVFALGVLNWSENV
jgi:hypothetical protein